MRVKETVIRPFGNSAGVTIPQEMLEQFGLSKGDAVSLRETPDGILITTYNAEFERVMQIAREGADRYRNAMRELSKR
jgi:antitoxin MazE